MDSWATRTPVTPVLLDPGAAALNQNDRDDDTKHGSGNTNDRGGFHIGSPFSQTGASIDVPSSQYLVAGQRSSRIFAAPPEDPRRPHYLALVRRR